MTNLLVQDKMSEKRLLVLRSVYPLALLSMSVNWAIRKKKEQALARSGMNRYTFLSATLVLAIAVLSLNIPPQGEHSPLSISLSVFFYKLFSEKLFYWKDWLSLGLKRLSTKKLAADLIVKNAVIFTSDASMPVADSMAIQNGRILRVGNYSSLQVSLPPPPLFFELLNKLVWKFNSGSASIFKNNCLLVFFYGI